MSRESNRPNKRGASNGRKDNPRGTSGGGDKKGNGYKAKRSFTRNKSLRENSEPGASRFSDKPKENIPFERKFKRPKPGEGPAKKTSERFGRRPFKRDGDTEKHYSSESKSKSGFSRKSADEKPAFDRESRGPRGKRNDHERSERPFTKGKAGERESKPFEKRVDYGDFEDGRAFKKEGPLGYRDKRKVKKAPPAPKENPDGLIRLNKYLSNAGIASRREADTLIQSGVVKVNGVVVDQLGYKIKPGDKVTYGDAAVRSERKVYLLLNKPKDYITTLDDPQERKTVMELIKGACKERVYPVGRLDRNTTGLLLFTNDGELTTKLTHPKFGIKKVYHVSLNKGLKPADFTAIVEGVELEDGFVKADDVAFVGEGKKEIGIEIHSGRNRIVRRLFEHLGYDVLKLDRVVFAGLTKKDLQRGKHRFLTAKEISFLKMLG